MHGQGHVEGERLDRPGQPAVGEHRRVDAADDRPQVAEGRAGGLAGLGEQPRGGLGVALEQVVGQAEVHAERDEPGLRAVVQVALDPAQLGRGVVDGLRAGRRQVGDPLLQRLGVAAGAGTAGRSGSAAA